MTANGPRASLWGDGNVIKLIAVMFPKFYEYTPNH